MSKEFEISKKLYNSRLTLSKWTGYKVAMKGPKGICSILNNTKDQTAKVSAIAVAIEKLLDGDLCVCPVLNQTDTYVEYKSSVSGETKALIVSLDPMQSLFRVISDVEYEHAVIPAVFGAVLYNEKLGKELTDAGADVNVVKQHMDGFPDVSENDMICVCDAFYYSIGKTYKVEYEADAVKFDAQKDRLVQGGLLTHDNPSGVPTCMAGFGSQQSSQIESNPLRLELPEQIKARARKGEFLIPYDKWTEEQKKMQMDLSFLDDKVFTKRICRELLLVHSKLMKILKKMEAGLPYDKILSSPVNLKLVGDPGTGKSLMAAIIFCALGLPNNMTNCKETSEEDEFEGLNKFINGKIYSIPTPFAKLYSVGGGILIEEANLPNPGILPGAIGQAVVYPYVLKVDAYREYRRHPLTVIATTLNVGAEGTKQMNSAFSTRMSHGIIVDKVPQDEFAQIVYRSTECPKECCDTAIRAYRAALTYLGQVNKDLCMRISMRACQEMAEQLSFGFPKDEAINSAFTTQIYDCDEEIALDLEEHLKRVV